jgi:hypothetical protein
MKPLRSIVSATTITLGLFSLFALLFSCGFVEESNFLLLNTGTGDTDAPFVLSVSPADGSKVDAGAIDRIDITYTEAVSGADVLGNYGLSGSGSGGLSLDSVVAMGLNSYRVSVSGVPGDGPVVLTISNVVDTVGNGLTGNTLRWVGWWDTGWTSRRGLTFDNSGQGEDLQDFPLLVLLDATRIDYGKTQGGGEDLRFLDTDRTELSHEIERWDESGESVVWVKVPQIDSLSATDFIWMYYGNDTVGDGQDAVNVWTNGYEMVMHLSESAGNYGDSSGNNRFGQPSGTTPGVNGKIGRAVQFNGSSDYVAMNMSYSGQWTVPEVTVSSWFRTSFTGAAYNDNWAFVDFDRSDFYDFYLAGDNGALEFSTSSTGSVTDDFQANTTGLNDGNWHLGWSVYNGANKIIYLNDSADGTRLNPHGGNNLGISSTRWGFIGDGSEATSFNSTRNNIYYEGLIDEIRISSIARTADWIAAQYLSMNDSFMNFGIEE